MIPAELMPCVCPPCNRFGLILLGVIIGVAISFAIIYLPKLIAEAYSFREEDPDDDEPAE